MHVHTETCKQLKTAVDSGAKNKQARQRYQKQAGVFDGASCVRASTRHETPTSESNLAPLPVQISAPSAWSPGKDGRVRVEPTLVQMQALKAGVKCAIEVFCWYQGFIDMRRDRKVIRFAEDRAYCSYPPTLNVGSPNQLQLAFQAINQTADRSSKCFSSRNNLSCRLQCILTKLPGTLLSMTWRVKLPQVADYIHVNVPLLVLSDTRLQLKLGPLTIHIRQHSKQYR